MNAMNVACMPRFRRGYLAPHESSLYFWYIWIANMMKSHQLLNPQFCAVNETLSSRLTLSGVMTWLAVLLYWRQFAISDQIRFCCYTSVSWCSVPLGWENRTKSRWDFQSKGKTPGVCLQADYWLVTPWMWQLLALSATEHLPPYGDNWGQQASP